MCECGGCVGVVQMSVLRTGRRASLHPAETRAKVRSSFLSLKSGDGEMLPDAHGHQLPGAAADHSRISVPVRSLLLVFYA